MSLFFETSSQANCLLYMLPLGFAVSFCMDAGRLYKSVRLLADVSALCATGLMVLLIMVLCNENTLRIYHLLGVISGMYLYSQGAGKIIRWAVRKQDLKRRAEKYTSVAGKDDAACAERLTSGG